ncbi:helix-turn-helix domain-containing protein [Tsukamurella tyrosinosolvens]|uniref:helix-turn-helix domain-containing protein n=1 Tax=Tsukamurella tyrosinosolvens TaxID=57704 RepID=UPI001E4418CD|nr:helix-turn-helix domain-containing protein [Tsukamurella tyrosinosolvens]
MIQGLTTAQLYAIIAVFNRVNEHGEKAYLSAESLARNTGISDSSARRALKSLADRGILIRRERGGRSGDGQAWASTYALGQLTGSTDHRRPVDPVAQPVTGELLSEGSTAHSRDVNRSIVPSQPVTSDPPSDPPTTDPPTTDPPAGGVALVNAGASTREPPPPPQSITEERRDIYVGTFDGMGRGNPSKVEKPVDPLAQYAHLLTDWTRKQLLARARAEPDDPEFTPERTVETLIQLYTRSNRPQTKNGLRQFVVEINEATTDAGLPEPSLIRSLLGIEAA